MFYKTHTVVVGGKNITISSPRFRRPAQKPQEFADKNIVLCGNCSKPILPGDWIIFQGSHDKAYYEKPGILKHEKEGSTFVACCTRWKCCASIAFACAELKENKEIRFFESAVEEALRTGEVVIRTF